MTITRAKKTLSKPSKTVKPATSAEQFIAGADAGGPVATLSPGKAAGASRDERALALVRSYIPWAAGAGVVPMPGIDLALISTVQFRMLAKLSELYGVPFREQAAKSTVATMLASLAQYALSGQIAAAVLKFVPVAGHLLGIAVMPAFAAASTFALGKVFITHFESGGTFLEFDPRKVQQHFQAEFDKARGTGARSRTA